MKERLLGEFAYDSISIEAVLRNFNRALIDVLSASG